MKLENLTEQHLIEIVKLYEEHCGSGREFRRAMFQEPSQILEYLRDSFEMGSCGEYRIGSRWGGHSKIFFDTGVEGNLEVWFSPNFDPKDRKGKKFKEAQKLGEVFEKAVKQYLGSQ